MKAETLSDPTEKHDSQNLQEISKLQVNFKHFRAILSQFFIKPKPVENEILLKHHENCKDSVRDLGSVYNRSQIETGIRGSSYKPCEAATFPVS